MIYDILYDNVRKRLSRLTPLPFDCGRLCDGACCTGDSDSGMYLFPFEENFYKEKKTFTVCDSELVYSDGSFVKFITCPGSCNRTLRPISCRIFPLFPYYNNTSGLKVIIDPRAKNLCPITYPEAQGYIQKRFFHEVEIFGKYLLKTPRGADFLETVSQILDDYIMLKG